MTEYSPTGEYPSDIPLRASKLSYSLFSCEPRSSQSADEHPSIFPRQMEATVYVLNARDRAHRDIEIPGREVKIRCAAESFFSKLELLDSR